MESRLSENNPTTELSGGDDKIDDFQRSIVESILYEEIDSVFRDELVFSHDFVPDLLVHRTDELRTVVLFTRNKSQHVFLGGPKGSGKTALVLFLGRLIEKLSSSSFRTDQNYFFNHLDIRKLKTPYVILTSIIRSLIPYFPRRGYSTHELLNILFETMEKRKSHMILCLDRVNYLDYNTEEGKCLIDSLASNKNISLVLIARDGKFLEKFNEETRNKLTKVVLDRYSSGSIYEILKERLSGLKETIDFDLLYRIAELADGDARYGIELLWKAGKQADKNQTGKITASEIYRAIDTGVCSIDSSMITSLKIDQKLLLLSITNAILSNDRLPVTFTEMRNEYIRTCKKYGKKDRKCTILWKNLRSLATDGLISLASKNGGVKGKTSAISIFEPNVALKKELEYQLRFILETPEP